MTLLIGLLFSVGLPQDLPWQFIGPDTSEKEHRSEVHPFIEMDPTDPMGASWYTYTASQAWHTDDYGETLNPISQVGMENQIWAGIAVAYDAPEILYAATGDRQYRSPIQSPQLIETSRWPGNGVYRSQDRGQTWTHLPFFPGIEDLDDLHYITDIATSALGDTVVVATARRILRSVDHGQSWDKDYLLPQLPDPRLEGLTIPTRMTVLNHHRRTLKTLIATIKGDHYHPHGIDMAPLYALISHDGGGTWENVQIQGQPLRTDLQNGSARNNWLFASDPADPDMFWMAYGSESTGKQMYRSTDSGISWQNIPVDVKNSHEWGPGFSAQLNSLHVHPLGGDTLTWGWAIGHYQDGKILIDGQPSEGGVIQHLIPAPDTYLRLRYIVTGRDTNHPDKLFTIGWEYEEYRLKQWHTGEITNSRVYDVCMTSSADGDLYAIKADGGRFLVGAEGQFVDDSAFRDSVGIEQGRSGASHAKIMWEGIDRGRWLGGSIDPVHCHPTRDTHLLWPSSDRIIRNADLSRFTSDVTIKPHLTQPKGSLVHRLSVSTQNPDIVWAAITGNHLVDPTHIRGLWKSEDFGNTWTGAHVDERVRNVHIHQVDDQVLYTNVGVSKDGGKSWENRELQRHEQIQSSDRIYSHPSDPSTIYTCTSKGIHQWTDYLRTRTVIADSLGYSRCHAMLIFPHNPDRIWMGGDTGLWETLNGGQTWSRQNRGLPNVPITALHLTHDRSEILAGTFGWGVFSVQAIEVDARITSVLNNLEISDETVLLSNYPNPFTSETTLQFSVEETSHIRLDVYDVLGRKLATATDRMYSTGSHQLRWYGSDLTSGVYFVRMEVDGQQIGVQKMVQQ